MTKSKNLGLNLPSRDNTTDLADINVISENFETIDNEFEKVYNKLNNTGVVNTVSGNPIVLKDSENAPLQNLRLFGKTTQNGTPTPDAPVPLVSVGDSGSFETGVYGRNIFNPNDIYKQNYIISTDGTEKQTDNWVVTKAIPISEKGLTLKVYATSEADEKFVRVGIYNANGFVSRPTVTEKTFTQADGTYIRLSYPLVDYNAGKIKFQVEVGTQATPYEPCNKQTLTMPFKLPNGNEVDFGKGTRKEKTVLITVNGSEEWQYNGSYKCYFFYPSREYNIKAKRGVGISTHFQQKADTDLCFFVSGGQNQISIYDNNGRWANTDALKSWLSENNVTFLLELETPIETPLAEQELNAYRQLHTNKGNTTILSEADMEVSYVADTKLYIDNKLAELTALTLEV